MMSVCRLARKHRKYIPIVPLLKQGCDLGGYKRWIPSVTRTFFFVGCKTLVFLTEEEVLLDPKHLPGIDGLLSADSGKLFSPYCFNRQ